MHIPVDRLTISSVRSGGPGGQNVNKVATKVEVRFLLDDADWIPLAVRERLRRLEARRISQEGELVIVSSRYRSRGRNLEDCLEKLDACLKRAAKRPKRRIPTKPTRASRARRLESKRRRSAVKKDRKKPERREDD